MFHRSRSTRAARLAAQAGRVMQLETLEPRVVLAATADAFHTSQYLKFDSANPLVDIAVGDLNGDGMDDVVAVDGSANAYLILSFKGAYRDQIILTTSQTSNDRVEMADLDGDGDLDLALLDAQGTGNIVTFLNGGAGNFGSVIDTSFSLTEVVDWVVRDITGDNRADFVLLSAGAVRAYAGDGAGDFLVTSLFFENVGSANAAVDVGDIDGDGILDVAFMEDSIGAVYILLGTGGGAMSAVNTSLTVASFSDVADFALVDSDGDGKTNYLTVVDSGGAGRSRENLSTPGSLAQNALLTTTFGLSDTQSLAIGDVNGDGVADLVTASSSERSYGIAFGTPNNLYGSFYNTISSVVVSESISRVRLGDTNGDGRLDLFGMVGRSVLIHANLGNGTFSAPEVSSGGTASSSEMPDRALYGDLDGDGRADAVLFQTDGMDDNFRVKFSTLGRFSQDTIDRDTDLNTAILGGVLVDTDGDGDLDIVLIGQDSGVTRVQVFRNDGNRNFTTLAAGTIAGNQFAINAVWGGLLNGGTKGDILVADADNQRIIILTGLGSGNVTLVNRVRLGTDINDIAVGDMDGDGDRDLVLATDGGVAVLVEEGNFFYQTMITKVIQGGARAVAVGHYNPGNALDVAAIAGDGYGQFTFLRNETTTPNLPNLRLLPQTAFDLGGDMYDTIVSGDLDGDGSPDFVLSSHEDGSRFVVLQGDGFLGIRQSGFYEPESGFINVSSPGLIDTDGDGDLDLVMLSDQDRLDRRGIAIFRNYGDGTLVYPDHAASSIFTGRLPLPGQGNNRSQIATADFNNDGLQDIAVIESNNGLERIVVYLNSATGLRRVVNLDAGFENDLSTNIVMAGDVTGDNRPDIVVYNDTEERFYTLVNNGSGTGFSLLLAHSQMDLTYNTATLADLTGDGRLDIVAVDPSSENVVIMPGKGDGTFRNGAQRIVVAVPGLTFDSNVLVFDADGDGSPEFAVQRDLGGGNYDVRLHRQTSPGLFATSQIWAGTDDAADHLSASDLNGDGRLEVLVGWQSFSSPMHSILFNTSTVGSPSFTQVDYALPRGSTGRTGVFAADFDNDGRKELLATGFDGTALIELNAAGIPVASTVIGLSFSTISPVRFIDIDADGDLDLVGSDGAFDSVTGVGIYQNRLLGASRVSNVAPAIPGGPIFLNPQLVGSQVTLSYNDFLALSGVTDADGDEIRFRIVQVVNGSISGPGGIVNGTNTFRPGTSITYTAPNAGGASVVAFRVYVSDPFAESSVLIPVRVPLVSPLLAPPAVVPPAPSEGDEGPGWLEAEDGLDFGLFAEEPGPVVRI